MILRFAMRLGSSAADVPRFGFRAMMHQAVYGLIPWADIGVYDRFATTGNSGINEVTDSKNVCGNAGYGDRGRG